MKPERTTRGRRTPNSTSQRGVSPIIATILLVAITVVLAAVLYVIVANIGGGGPGHPPVAVTLVEGSVAQCDGDQAAAVVIGGTSATLSTNGFGMTLDAAGLAAPVPAGTAGARSTTSCGVAPPASGWIALLIAPGGSPQLAYYDSGGWHDWNATTYPVVLASGQVLEVVVSPSISLGSDTLALYSTGSGSVSGQANL